MVCCPHVATGHPLAEATSLAPARRPYAPVGPVGPVATVGPIGTLELAQTAYTVTVSYVTVGLPSVGSKESPALELASAAHPVGVPEVGFGLSLPMKVAFAVFPGGRPSST